MDLVNELGRCPYYDTGLGVLWVTHTNKINVEVSNCWVNVLYLTRSIIQHIISTSFSHAYFVERGFFKFPNVPFNKLVTF